MVGLDMQRSNSFSAHPLGMNNSTRAVGFIRPGPCFGSMSRIGLVAIYDFSVPLDFIGLEDGTVLGDELYGDALGIG